MPYIQTRVVYQWRPSLRTAYRICRERNNFSIWESVRYAWWLAHGNKLLYPGEFAAWANAQIAEHPYAIGITLGVCGYVLLMWIGWMVIPHGYFRQW